MTTLLAGVGVLRIELLCCRDRGVTMLMRVDICAAEGGVLVVNISHQAAGFAPYRLDNCSSQILHIRYYHLLAYAFQNGKLNGRTGNFHLVHISCIDTRSSKI